MEFLSLDLIKQQVRATDFDVEDALLEFYGNAAEEAVLNHIDRTLAEMVEEGGGDVPYPVKAAALLMAGHLYEHRAATDYTVNAIPYGVAYLLQPYRRLLPR